MMYLSKGVVRQPSTEEQLNISHCGATYKVTGQMAKLWLAGRFEIRLIKDVREEMTLQRLERMGLAEVSKAEDAAARYRMLTNCTVCPSTRRVFYCFLSSQERLIMRWITKAGLRLTVEELVYLVEHDVRPDAQFQGIANRQRLVETIYTRNNIGDGILITQMEKSPARDQTVATLLSLLHKKRLLLV